MKSSINVNIIFIHLWVRGARLIVHSQCMCVVSFFNGKIRLPGRVLERQKQDQTSLSWRPFCLQLRDV